jgi:hypothetical protein
MARLQIDDSVYNVRRSRIKTRVMFPRIIEIALGFVGATNADASEELRLLARTFAFTLLDTEYVSGENVLPLVDSANLSGDVLEKAWDQFGNLDALTYVKDFWAAHTEANTPLNDPAYTPETAAEIEAEKKA